MPTVRGLLLACATLLGGALLMLLVAGVCGNPHLGEDLTGEADPVQQIKAGVGVLKQRPIATDDFAPTAPSGLYPIGANTFFEQEVEEAKVRRSMTMLREAGVKWIRQEFPWDRIEPDAKGRFTNQFGSTWDTYDRIVRLATEYGIEVMPRLTLPPKWTRADNSVPRAPPDNYNDYGDFVAAVVQRYQGRVHYYQLWNEPNTVLEWGAPPNAADFVRLLRTGYRRAKAIDPSVTIVAAALSPTIGTPDGLNENDLTYLQEMYGAGAADSFDIMSSQGYGLWTGPGDRRAEFSRTNFARIQLVREVMVYNGDGHKPLWLAEMGWSALPLDFQGEAIHGRVTEQQQARYTQQAFERIEQEWPWVGVAFVWQFRRVSDEQRSQADFYFRMVDPDFTPRPVYFAVQQAASGLGVLGYGWHPVTHWAIQRRGEWSAATRSIGGVAVVTLTATSDGAVLAVPVQGRHVSVQMMPSSGGGTLQVLLDGQRVGGIRSPQSDPESSPAEEMVAIPVLPEGTHTLELRADGGGPVEVAGILVSARDPAWVPPLLGGILLLASGLVLVALLPRGRAV